MAGVIEPIGLMAMALLLGRRSTSTIGVSSRMISMIPARASSSEARKEKQAKAIVIKRLRKENKDIFGDLLETKYDKVKREKKAKKNAPKTTEDGQITMPVDKTEFSQAKAAELKLEAGWAVKNFPQRTKIIRRENPGRVVHAFDAGRPPSGQYKIFKKNSASPPLQEITSKEISALPTMKQVYDSFQESLDIMPSFEMKLVRKGSKESSPGQFSDSVDPLIGQSENGGVFVDAVKIEEQEMSVNANANVKSENHEDKTSHGDNSHPLSSSVNSHMDSEILSFPYDNPDKKLERENNSETQEESAQIISFPFPTSTSVRSKNFTGELLQPRIPSVSKILNATIAPEQAEILRKWQEKMIAKMGEEGFHRYKEDLFINGKKFHANIQSHLSGTPIEELEIEEAISGHWSSLQSVFPKIDRVHVLESRVYHPQLNYCGIVDCVAKFRDKLVVIDWKTSEKRKSNISMTYDTPLQIAAYIGAINYDPSYSLKIHAGLVVIAYQDGTDCQTYLLNSSQVETYWKQWLGRLKLYQEKAAQPESDQ